MTITAKYASVCATCGAAIQPGQRIEWAKGSPSRHADCSATTTTVPTTSPARKAYRPTTCRACGHQERHDSRGYPIGDRILRSGECQSCYEERKMGY